MRVRSLRKDRRENDPLYKSRIVTRMINNVMKAGKKRTAEKIVYGVLENLSSDEREAANLLEQAVRNVMPNQEVRSRRVGGATYQVPMSVKHDRGEALAIRWIIQAAGKVEGKTMVESLTEELKAALKNTGAAVQKKEDMHKMAQANRAFAHFRW